MATTAPCTDKCIHCNLPIPPGDLVIDEIDGKELHFCCQGCRGVYRIITGAGLGRFYQQREWGEDGVPPGAFEADFDENLLAGHVTTYDDTNAEISLVIEGVRCASCVWLLEKLLGKQPGIAEARVNYGSHRARIRFNPQTITPAQIFTAISQLGYRPHPFTAGAAQQAAAREQRSLLIRFGTAAFLAMQLMAFSFALYGGYFHGIDPNIRQLLQYFAAAVTTPVVFYSGWPFLTGAWRSLKNRAPSMDVLITLGVMTAYSYSLFALFSGGEVYFETAAMVITLLLLGRLFEGSARNRSLSGIDKLLQLAPENANKLDGDTLKSVASASLVVGDRILVRPGERIPIDGRIVEGNTELDESSISGEPMPVLRQQGEDVSAGTLNLLTSVTLEVTRVAGESFVARMARLVEEAQNRKAPIQSLADKVATLFVPCVILIAVATFLYWSGRDLPETVALLNAVSVLIVACPCALGLATPTAVLVASGNAAARGILFRGGDILESTARVSQVAFDKTGTLTLGKPRVTKLITAPGVDKESLLQRASRLESGSSHPIALGILERAKEAGIHPQVTEAITTIPGRGLKLSDANGETLVGSRQLLTEHQVTVPEIDSGGFTEVHVSSAGHWQGVLLVEDPLRRESQKAVNALIASGLQTMLLTGDRPQTAERVCKELALDGYEANQSPADKAAWLEKKQQTGLKVMMVGDGINDAPALSLADVGCAMAGGTDIALETSDLVLNRPNLYRLYEAVFIARKTLRVIKQNLLWAFTYNLITIPLAASGALAPVWAAAAMASSSVLVVGNSLRLGRMIRKTFSVAKLPATH